MSLQHLVLRYAAFAVIATCANLGVQRLILGWDRSQWGFVAAVLAGTLVGLVIKYLLDKRWIFADFETGARAHGKKFTLYTLMGVVTTAVFWGTETTFWILWQKDSIREVGAIIGLAIGYVVKFNLDRRFVFVRSSLDIRE